MAQKDLNLIDQNGSDYLNDDNAARVAISTFQSGGAEPPTVVDNMVWADTSSFLARKRNSNNTAWLNLGRLNDVGGGTMAHGQCFLGYVNSTTLQLDQWNGFIVWVNDATLGWMPMAVQSPFPQISNAEWAPNQFRYIYAYNNGGIIGLESDTVSYVRNSASGVFVKSTDNTRTIVGAALTDGSNNFIAPAVISFFNRFERIYESFFTTNVTDSTSSFVAPSTASLSVQVPAVESMTHNIALTGAVRVLSATVPYTMTLGVAYNGTIIANTRMVLRDNTYWEPFTFPVNYVSADRGVNTFEMVMDSGGEDVQFTGASTPSTDVVQTKLTIMSN